MALPAPTHLLDLMADFAGSNCLRFDRDNSVLDADDNTRCVELASSDVEGYLELRYFMDSDEEGKLAFSEHVDSETFEFYLTDWLKGDTFRD